ncbi:MAG: hypothetical protein WCA30_07395 [Dermatophilaceae bacterium]
MSISHPIRERLRVAATRAMKDRDRAALSAYRHALAGIDNAEAVVPAGGIPSAGALEQAATGLGAAEVARRELSDADIRAVVESEIAEHRQAATTLEAHDADRADRHRRAAELLAQVLAF